MNIIIKKATIKDSLFLSYEFEQKDVDIKNNIKTSSDAPIHDDLRTAFRALIPHFAFICEEIMDADLVESAITNPEMYLEDKENSNDESFFKYRVFDFQINEKNGAEKLRLSGSKKLVSGKEVYFSTPELNLDEGDYKFSNELKESIEKLKEEVLAYMQGKQAPKSQMDMFDGPDDSEDSAFE